MYKMSRLLSSSQYIVRSSVRWRSSKSDYLISTPIFYVNSVPHIGHLYSALLADAHFRFRKLKDPDMTGIFCTGTDEHGMKVQQAAQRAGMQPQDFCDDISSKFHKTFNKAGISYTDYIRTTEQRHKNVVQQVWNHLLENDHLYRDTYSSWYSVQDETFLPSTHVEERNGEHFSLDSGHKVEWASEENWCFRLERQRESILKWIHDKDPIQPAKFTGQVKAWLEDDRLGDISVSRPESRLSWGIPVPSGGQDEVKDTIYVWLDALVNYLTVVDFQVGRPCPNWPPTVHVIGKDILKFHAVYWPAFLLALDLELPKRLLVHSHWMVEDVKMSKSLGNVLCPDQLMESYGVDGTRYMLLREGVPHADGNFCKIKMVQYLNHELADTLGNLLNRICSTGLNPDQVIPSWKFEFKEYETDLSKSLMELLEHVPDEVDQSYEHFNFYKGIVHVMDCLRATNHFVQDEKPWELKKTDVERLQFILALSLDSLRICGILLQPIVPSLSTTLLNKLNVPKTSRNFENSKHKIWTTTSTSPHELDRSKVVLFKKIRE